MVYFLPTAPKVRPFVCFFSLGSVRPRAASLSADLNEPPANPMPAAHTPRAVWREAKAEKAFALIGGALSEKLTAAVVWVFW